MSATVFFNSANELATLSNTFSVAGTPTDPTIATLTVTSPANVVTAYTGGQLTHVALSGLYSRDVVCNEAGTWTYQWDGTTAASDTVAGTWEVSETGLGKLYCTVEALKSRLGITNSNFDFELHGACFATSRNLEHYCGRTFYRTVSEARTFVPTDLWRVELPSFNDLVSLTTLKTDLAGDGTFETTWLTTDYQLQPQNPTAAPERKPYTRIRAVGTQVFPVAVPAAARADRVEVTGVFGWPAVPYGIKQAALIMAADTFKLKDSAFGIAGEGDFVQRIGENRRAQSFANPYRRYPTWSA